jgi:hypothetical protein
MTSENMPHQTNDSDHPAGASWADFEAGDPTLAASGRALFYRDGTGKALLATVAGDAPPRINPIWLAILDGRLLAFINPSAKQRDLVRDTRYALHAMMGPADTDEFMLRGRVRAITDAEDRGRIATAWAFLPGDEYLLVEFSIDSALLGHRDGPEAWPPTYSSWRAHPTPA